MSLPVKLVFDGMCNCATLVVADAELERYALRLTELERTRNGNIYMVMVILTEIAAGHKVGLHIDKRGVVRYVF